MRRTLLVLALLVPLAACSSDDGGSTAAPSPSGSAAATSAASAGTVVLRGDGLAVVTEQGTQQLPFGSPSSVVTPALESALGEPEPLAVECGQGVRDTLGFDGFDVLFDEESFVGWDDSSGALATEDGLQLGATKAQVQQALPDAMFSVSTVGPEFTSPSGLGGFLDGEAPDSTLVGLTGGESCVVR